MNYTYHSAMGRDLEIDDYRKKAIKKAGPSLILPSSFANLNLSLKEFLHSTSNNPNKGGYSVAPWL